MTTTPEEIRSVIDSNLVGTIFCTQAVVPTMLEAKEGTIINVSSLAGVTPGMLGGMIYSAAKAAVINFTTYLNSEFKNTGIRSSVVIPGEVDTPILQTRALVPGLQERANMMRSEDIAEAILLAASLPLRTVIEEMSIMPTRLRDTSADIAAAKKLGAPDE